MQDKKREILNQVRDGVITAEEGMARLEELSAEEPAAPRATTTATALPAGPSSLPSAGAAKAIKVVSQFGSAEVVADPSVTGAVADGPHTARIDGDTLIIEHVPFQEDDTFKFGLAGRRVEINGFDFKTNRRMKVRMNPDLPLTASVQAGSFRVDGVHGRINAEVQAGSCIVNDFRGPINLIAQAGSVTASGRIDSGDSKIRCEMGSVRVSLDKQSSVKITARTTLGKVTIDGDGGEFAIAGQGAKAVTIGGGVGTLDIEGTMGSVRVSAS